MAAMLLYANRQLRRERIFRDRLNPLDTHTDEELVSRYRLDRASILHLIDCVNDNIETSTYRSKALSSPVQVLIALRYYATGSFQKLIADAHGVSVPSVSRVIHRVSRAITTCVDDKLSIKFPYSIEDINTTKEGFHQIAGFPNVVGTIDGTQVAIIAPSGENEPLFVCRKGFHSINVQATADSKLRLTSVLAKFPGSAHDSYILQQSGVSGKMVEERMAGSQSVLLGDSGYPLKTWLMVPFASPGSRAEQRYNNAHRRTRCSIERAFGVLKSRFRCVHHKSGGCLMYVPQKCVNIIIAVCKLHNLCINNNLPLPEVEPDDIDDHIPVIQNPPVQNVNATNFRNNLVRQRYEM